MILDRRIHTLYFVTFFSYQSKNDYLIESSDTADFFVNRKYTLEIGGKIQFHYGCSVSLFGSIFDLVKEIPEDGIPADMVSGPD